MPRSTQAIYSFGGGVMSPSMEMRADSERYERATRYMRNWVVTPQGGISKRHGSEYLFDVKNPADPVRLFAVRRGGDESDALVELGANYQRFYVDESLLSDTVNPYLQTQLYKVQAASQSPLFVTVHPSHPPVISEQESATEITTQYFPVARVPTRNFDDQFSPGVVASTATYRVQFNGSWNDGNTFWFVYNNKTNTFTNGALIEYPFSGTSGTMISVLEQCCAQAVDIGGSGMTFTVTTSSGQNAYEIELNGVNAGLPMSFEVVFPQDRQVSVEITEGTPAPADEPAWSYPFVVFHNGTYYQCILPHGSDASNEPGVGAEWTTYWFALPGQPSYWDWAYPDGNNWVTGQTYSPQGRGFPQTVTFHKERLIFGGSANTFEDDADITSTNVPAAPTTIWGSRVGEYLDFQIGPNADDPLQFTLATQGTPAISWMTSLQGLLVGTTAGNFLINRDAPLTPTSIVIDKQNAARSAISKPSVVNHQVFSLQLGRRKVEMSQYQRNALSILSEDVSVVAEHLFYDAARDLALQQVPETTLLMTRQDNDIVGLSYSPETQIAAWWEWTTRGGFYDVRYIYDDREETQQEVAYLCAFRNNGYVIERIIYPPADFENRTNLDGLCYMDSYERGTLSNSDTITVPARMANAAIRVTVNDADLGEFVADGTTVTLPTTFTGYYYVGYSYTADTQTFERVQGNPQGVGFGTARRWNKLYVRLVDSALPIINGQRAPDRTPASPMDLPEPLRQGDVRLHNIGYDDGSITIEQDLPFPTHIVGLFGQIGSYDA